MHLIAVPVLPSCFLIPVRVRYQLCFFFQAEDGIRGHCVTGVQTCALPIYPEVGAGAEGWTADVGEAFGKAFGKAWGNAGQASAKTSKSPIKRFIIFLRNGGYREGGGRNIPLSPNRSKARIAYSVENSGKRNHEPPLGWPGKLWGNADALHYPTVWEIGRASCRERV